MLNVAAPIFFNSNPISTFQKRHIVLPPGSGLRPLRVASLHGVVHPATLREGENVIKLLGNVTYVHGNMPLCV
jgi:hypothetical protein